MIRTVAAKYALRSLLRHPRRTLLSMVGAGIGCGIALFGNSWGTGAAEMQIRAISESGGGHLRIVHADWPTTREDTLRLAEWEQALEAAQALPNVVSAAPHAQSTALLAFGNRSAGVPILGVVPHVERASNRIVQQASLEGRYLRADDEGAVVIGRTLAKRLDVELDDDLYMTLAGRDEIQSAMLRIVGILGTGSKDLDAITCHVTLQDLEQLTGYAGAADVSILLDDYALIGARLVELQKSLPPGNTVITWKEVNPGLAGNVEGDRAFLKMMSAIIVLVVILGIASAQLSAVLERRTEFAILSALGMKGRQLIALMVLEAVVVGLGGALVALLLGGSGAYYLATEGVDFSSIMGDDLSFSNVLFEPVIYGNFGSWLVWYALAISIAATVAASIYPAWLATRVNPADALRIV